MTGGRARSLLQVAVLYLLYQASLGFEPTLLEKNITSDDIFLKLGNVHAMTQPVRFKQDNISFSGQKLKSGNLTLDEKCRRGLPLSVRWTSYGPYASLLRSTNHPVKTGVALVGIFPRVINKVLSKCCHQNTRVQTGEFIPTLKSLEKSLSSGYSYDMTFPVGLQSMTMTEFKDLAVVPLLRAPRTTLFVPEISKKSGKTFELFRTVGMAWPILVFIFLAAVLSGVFIWVFDHIKNPDEFPTTFVSGVWEGFWWAVVTMTTVGYGDRAPRSILGRLFCIIWIVIGMSIIAIFTAMITASLSASIQYRFVVHGSVMGAVAGSQEERIGTGMNADIQTFNTPDDVVKELVDTTRLEVAIMDNYLLSYYADVIKREPVRVEANLEQPINYGFVLGPNATEFSQCFRRFVRNDPQKIFDIIRKNLNPLKNPTDDISEEVKASQGFLGEEAFHMILYGLVGSLVVFFLLGIIWEYGISKIRCGKRRQMENEDKPPRKTFLQSLIGFRLSQNSGTHADEIRHLETIKQRSTRIRQLIREYDEFYEKWIEKLRGATDEEEWRGFIEKPSNGKNGSLLMVTYNGNN